MRASTLMNSGLFAAIALLGQAAATGMGADLGALPKCATQCVTGALKDSGCQPTDVSCICQAATFISSIACCVATNCQKDQAAIVTGFATQLCGAYGITFPSAADVCSSTSSSKESSLETTPYPDQTPVTSTTAIVSGTTTVTSTSCPTSSTSYTSPTTSTGTLPTATSVPTVPLPQTTPSGVCPTTCPIAVTSYVTVSIPATGGPPVTLSSGTAPAVPKTSTTKPASLTTAAVPVVTPSGTSAGAVGSQTSSRPAQYTPGNIGGRVEVGSGVMGLAGLVAAALL